MNVPGHHSTDALVSKPKSNRRNRQSSRPNPNQVFEEARNVPFDPSKLTKYVSVDCEMVKCGKTIHLGRVSAVNELGEIILDKYVRVAQPVTNYHTNISGLTPRHLAIGEDFDAVSDEMYEVLSDRIMVGHSLKNDLSVIFPDRPPPYNMQSRDLSTSTELMHLVDKHNSDGHYKVPSLREMTNKVLGRDIQNGMHSSVEDARAAMEIFLLFKESMEMLAFDQTKKCRK